MANNNYIKIFDAVKSYNLEVNDILQLALDEEINLYIFWQAFLDGRKKEQQRRFDNIFGCSPEVELFEKLTKDLIQDLFYSGHTLFYPEHSAVIDAMSNGMNQQQDSNIEAKEVDYCKINLENILVQDSELFQAISNKKPEPLKLTAIKIIYNKRDCQTKEEAKEALEKIFSDSDSKKDPAPAIEEILTIVYYNKKYPKIREEYHIACKCFPALYRSVNSKKSPDENHTAYIKNWLKENYSEDEIYINGLERILHLVNPNTTGNESSKHPARKP